MRKIELLSMLIFLLFGCMDNRKGGQGPDLGKEILVQYRNATKIIDADSIITNLSMIPLQNTNPPIGNIEKLLFCNKHMIIWDKKGKSIWIFNIQGKLITSISSLGKGPKEYVSIENVSITPPNIINIVDPVRKSIIKYDFNGNFIERSSTISYASDYIEHNKFKYYFYYEIVASDKHKYYIQSENESGFQSGIFPFSNTWSLGGHCFYEVNDEVYFNRSYDNKIYKIIASKFSVAYTLNFGLDSFPIHQMINAKNSDNYHKLLSSKKYVGAMSNISLNRDFIVFNYRVKNGTESSTYSFIYNLKNEKCYNYESIKTKKYVTAPAIPIATDGEFFYSKMETWKLSNTSIDKLQKEYNIIVSINSNPIIVKFKYK